ncbi:MAG: helix-turn-helix domain-containing protein [Neptuniibacter sp.]
MTLSDFVSDEEGRRLIEALRLYKWNITQVSEELNICRSTVYRKMKKYNIVQPNDIY